MHAVSLFIIILILLGWGLMVKGEFTVTGGLVITNITVFVVEWSYIILGKPSGHFIDELGFKAETLANGENWWSILTSLYIHGGFLHIMGNMLFLVLLGMPFEERIGSKKFALIYFASGILANLLDGGVTILMDGASSSEAQVIGVGASGAIFGIMGAFTILYPRDEIPMILGPIFLQRVPVYIAGLSYALFEIVAVQMAPADNIGHIAHVSGFACGVFIGPLIAKTEIKVRKLDYSRLEELLKVPSNSRLELAIKNIQKAEVKEVLDAWWEEILTKARCPICDGGLHEGGHGLKCDKCDYTLDLRQK